MTKDNVIKGTFGSKKESENPAPKLPLSLNEQRTMFDEISIRMNSSKLEELDPETREEIQLQYKMLEIQLFINGLAGYRPTPETIVLRRQALKALSHDALKKALIQSVRSDWQKQPTLYKALLAELDSRATGIKVQKIE